MAVPPARQFETHMSLGNPMRKFVLCVLLAMAPLTQADSLLDRYEGGATSPRTEELQVGRGAVSDGRNFEIIAQVAAETAQGFADDAFVRIDDQARPLFDARRGVVEAFAEVAFPARHRGDVSLHRGVAVGYRELGVVAR